MGGVARRNWARNKNAMDTTQEFNQKFQGKAHITEPYLVSDNLVDESIENTFPKE
jgi:urocanate hydratase